MIEYKIGLHAQPLYLRWTPCDDRQLVMNRPAEMQLT
jgi:hypothetical protein